MVKGIWLASKFHLCLHAYACKFGVWEYLITLNYIQVGIPKKPKCQWSLKLSGKKDSGHFHGETQIENTNLATKQR